MALWYEAIQEAEAASQIVLEAELKSYLVFLLMRHVCHQELAKVFMAESFLKGLQYPPRQRESSLQQVGDQCLLISGLFPGVAEKKQVKLRYYVELGQIAYEVISRKNDDIYSSLSKQFIPLMDVLNSFRPSLYAPLPLEVTRLWEESAQRQLKGPEKPR